MGPENSTVGILVSSAVEVNLGGKILKPAGKKNLFTHLAKTPIVIYLPQIEHTRPVYLEIHFFSTAAAGASIFVLFSECTAGHICELCASLVFVALKNRDTDGAISYIVTPKNKKKKPLSPGTLSD